MSVWVEKMGISFDGGWGYNISKGIMCKARKEKNMKKRILSFLLVAALGVSLCACMGPADNAGGDSANNGSGSGGESNPLLFEVPEGGYDGEMITIKFDHTFSSRYWDVLDACIVEFNKMYPMINVQHQIVGTCEDIYTWTTMSNEKNRANIVCCSPEQMEGYIEKEMVIALDKLMKDTDSGFSQAELDDCASAFSAQGREYGDGHGYVYSLPISKVNTERPDFCIMKKENPQEMMASWLFVKFLLTNKEFQAAFS